MLHRIMTLLVVLWLLFAVGEPLFHSQGWTECHQIAGVAGRSLGYVVIRLGLAAVLCWGLIPAGGKG